MTTSILTLAAAPSWVLMVLIPLFLLVCVLMVLVVLIQRPQGGGLAGAFGVGAGSSQTAFGAKTGDALTVATISIFVVYILAAIALNYAVNPATEQPVNATASQASPNAATEGELGLTKPMPESASPVPGADTIPGDASQVPMPPTPQPDVPIQTPAAPAEEPAVPASPAPVEPAPTDPTPSAPAQPEPAPSEPAPIEPAPSEPAPQ